MISFFRGHPSDDLLPAAEVAAAAAKVLQPHAIYDDEETRHPLQYGTDPGAQYVREIIAEFSNRTLKGTATPDCLNLTNGASYGAAFALIQLCSLETKRAFVVSPTYFLINRVLTDAGLGDRTTAIVESPETGLDLDHLERELKRLSGTPPKPQAAAAKKGVVTLKKFQFAMYLVPTFSNPGGLTLSREERVRLLDLARQYDMVLLCDEVYEWLDFTGAEHPPLLVTLDRETLPEGSVGNVVANFSMSKVLGPGLRVGWQEVATPQLAHQLSQAGAIMSGGTPAQLNTFIVAQLMKDGEVDRIIKQLNGVYSERAKVYEATMERAFPKGTHISGGDGGYFFWVTLPEGYDVQAITAQCASQGIIVAPGNNFEVVGDAKGWGKRCLRFCLSYYGEDEAVPALERVGEICSANKA